MEDILRFPKDVRADVGAQKFRSHNLDSSAQEFLQKERKAHEVIEGLFGGIELDQQVDITFGVGLISQDRSEERKASNAEPSNLGFGGKQALDSLLAGQDGYAHK